MADKGYRSDEPEKLLAEMGTLVGVIARVWQCMLALMAAIWNNQNTGQPVQRSLATYDHRLCILFVL
jgi:hypothetical protein